MQELISKTRELWEVYVKAESINDMAPFFHVMDDNIAVIGTGEHLLSKNKEEFIAAVTQEKPDEAQLILKL